MLDDRIKKDLTDRYQAGLGRSELLSRTQLDAYCGTFRRRFGPEVLANLDGEALLSAMHEHGNRDSLVYWLEFKNDEEFPGLPFGSIAGGSALKFGIHKRNETGAWMTGSPQKQQELTVQEAISVARHHRDQLLAVHEWYTVGRHLTRGWADDGAYVQLQANLARLAGDRRGAADQVLASPLLAFAEINYQSVDPARFAISRHHRQATPSEKQSCRTRLSTTAN